MPDEQLLTRHMAMLFTDIEASVRMKFDLGTDGYRRLLKRHDEILRGIVGSTPGASVVADTGDGAFACFATAPDAVRAALRLQHAVTTDSVIAGKLKVRVGINAGQVPASDALDGLPKLTSRAVDLAARVMSLANGGQILLTPSAFEDASEFVTRHPDPPAGVPAGSSGPAEAGNERRLRWVAHGAYPVKGFPKPVDVFEVSPADTPPLPPPRRPAGARRLATAAAGVAAGIGVAAPLLINDVMAPPLFPPRVGKALAAVAGAVIVTAVLQLLRSNHRFVRRPAPLGFASVALSVLCLIGYLALLDRCSVTERGERIQIGFGMAEWSLTPDANAKRRANPKEFPSPWWLMFQTGGFSTDGAYMLWLPWTIWLAGLLTTAAFAAAATFWAAGWVFIGRALADAQRRT